MSTLAAVRGGMGPTGRRLEPVSSPLHWLEATSRPRCMWLVALVLVCSSGRGFAVEPPMRIVSTSPSITETLFALGLGDRVVGVSQFCHYPADVRALPKVGTFLRPDAELIARLKPDLVIVHAGSNGIEHRLSSLQIPFISVERGTLASVFATIRTIGIGANVPDRADALVEDLQAGLTRVHRAVAGRPRRKVLLIVGRRPGALTGLVAVGRDSYLNDLVTIAGGINVLGSDELPEYPRISMETVISLEPDVIIDAADMGDDVDDRRRRRLAVEALWAKRALPPFTSGRVFAALSDAFVVPGPRTVEVAKTLAVWLHGVTVR